MAETFHSLCDEFWNSVKDAYAFYLDGFKGLEMMRDDIEERQRASNCSDDSLVPYMKQYDEPLELHGLLHTDVGTFKRRNAEHGRNYELLGNLCLVAIYAWWEDHYRERFSTYLGKQKNDIKAPIMGDIRLLRTAIVHKNGIATDDVGKCEILKWFKPGERILLTFERFETIIAEIRKFLDVFYQQSLMIG